MVGWGAPIFTYLLVGGYPGSWGISILLHMTSGTFPCGFCFPSIARGQRLDAQVFCMPPLSDIHWLEHLLRSTGFKLGRKTWSLNGSLFRERTIDGCFYSPLQCPLFSHPLCSERLSHWEATSLSQKLGAPPLRSTSLVTHGSQGPIPPTLPSPPEEWLMNMYRPY